MMYHPMNTDKREAIKSLTDLRIQVKTLKAVKALYLLKSIINKPITIKP
jgi:hypothetical protein